MSDIEIYATGLVSCSVCADDEVTAEAIEQFVNLENPTGISSRWTIADDETFADGTPMPCPCDKVPGRKHYLLTC